MALPPPKRVELGHFTRFWGRNNYPQWSGTRPAQHLVKDLQTGATLDRYAADQVIPFAALAAGESRFRIPQITEHVASSAWLAQTFLGAEVTTAGQVLSITGGGLAHP